MKPIIGVLFGDPNGIGPELAAKLLAEDETRDSARVLGIGDTGVLASGMAIAGAAIPLNVIQDAGAARFDPEILDVLDVPSIAAEDVTPGKATPAGGRSVYETVKIAVALAKAGVIDGFCFAPMNKGALKAGGSPHGDEHILFAELLGYDGPFCEHNVLGDLWTVRATSHIPLKDVAAAITTDRVVEMTRLAYRTLSGAGYESPRIAVCGLNPHNGDGGLFGREEIDVIAPAVAAARAEGIAAEGPFPADTVFLKARDGGCDAVVTMYHDQGQIAMKLMGFGKGITVSGGLPVPIATPASGTAFDIVGKGVASVDGLREAFRMVRRMAETKAARAAAAE
jgi:4-hydroxythreonine-4-phosphate dehydrogenase